MLNSEILNAAIWRFAIKTFDAERKISDEDFTTLLEIARYSPSSFGLEPWNIIVVNDKSLRAKISEYASGAHSQLATASHFIIFTVPTDLEATSEYFKHINFDIKKLDSDNYSAFIARFTAFQTEKLDITDFRKRIDWAAKQAYIALANMVLASAIMGIDSCPIEGFIPSAVEGVLKERGFIQPESEHIVVMAAFGYRNTDFERAKTRRPLNEVIRYI
jgi:nitroreductase